MRYSCPPPHIHIPQDFALIILKLMLPTSAERSAEMAKLANSAPGVL